MCEGWGLGREGQDCQYWMTVYSEVVECSSWDRVASLFWENFMMGTLAPHGWRHWPECMCGGLVWTKILTYKCVGVIYANRWIQFPFSTSLVLANKTLVSCACRSGWPNARKYASHLNWCPLQVCQMSSKSSGTTIQHLRAIFSCFGLPETLVSLFRRV